MTKQASKRRFKRNDFKLFYNLNNNYTIDVLIFWILKIKKKRIAILRTAISYFYFLRMFQLVMK